MSGLILVPKFVVVAVRTGVQNAPPMATIYISSTQVDLENERKMVSEALVAARHLPRDSYAASDEPLAETCRRDVAACDVYVLLLGRRYGHRPPLDNPGNLSITHIEFREAVERDKPLVVLKQANPPMHLSDADQGRVEDDQSRKAFWAEVDQHAVPALWSDAASLVKAVLVGVNVALQRERDKLQKDAPPITPGVAPPHARLLAHSLLLVHLAGKDDDALAARLAQALGQREVGWNVLPWRWAAEEGIDWRTLDQLLATCRGAVLLLTDSAARFDPDIAPLREVARFAARQCGFVAGLTVGAAAAALPGLDALGLHQRHALDGWAAAPAGALTPDLAQAVRAMRGRHRDLEDAKLVGLQCVVVAMTLTEARALAADAALPAAEQRLRSQLTAEQQAFLDAALARAGPGFDWTQRYGATREHWQPFGPHDGLARPALDVLREVVDDINGQEVMPRREAEALRGHRIRLRPYAFDPIVTKEPRVAKLMPQVMARRVLVLVDELSLCHPTVRDAAIDLLTDPLLAVATVAPFDPPAEPVEAGLDRKRGMYQDLVLLKKRFLEAMDPNCELNLGSPSRLMRWLRLAVPDTLTGQGGLALQENRAALRGELGLSR
jgi:hypothetical protein